MKKITVFILVLLTVTVLGCNAQRKPAPENPQTKLVPRESTIGFSQIDIDQAPASIRKMAAELDNTPMVIWAHDNNNSYILMNTGEEDEIVEVSKVIQRVPAQDFVWLDVKLNYKDVARDSGNNPDLVVVKLENADQDIDGVGFELIEIEDEEKGAKEVKQQAAPAPAPTPAPAAKEQVKEPAPAQETPVRETRPEERQPQNQTPDENERRNVEQQGVPNPPNGE